MDLDSLLQKALAALIPWKRELLSLAIQQFCGLARRTHNEQLIALANFAENLNLGKILAKSLLKIVGPCLPSILKNDTAAQALAYGLLVIMGKYMSAEILDLIQCVLVAMISLATAAILVEWLRENAIRAAISWANGQSKAAWDKVAELIIAVIAAFSRLGERLSGLVKLVC